MRFGAISAVGLVFVAGCQSANTPAPTTPTAYSALSTLAKWPLPRAKTEKLRSGVTHSSLTSGDGTQIDFIDFDFKANPKLRFEIFDQDEDDEKPLDNRVLYYDRNVAQVTRQFNESGRGPIIAGWNGAFFGYDKKVSEQIGFHVSPVVLRGKVQFNTANHRWAWGVKQTPTGPQWKVFFKPSRNLLEKEFDFAAGSLQCLIKEGKPLKLEPFPAVGSEFKEQPVPSTATEAGHVPHFDHMRTCRASMGWSQDNNHLYLLTVKEPDAEGASSVALSHAVRGEEPPIGTTLSGGWTVADVQQFWQSKKVWGAVNSDAGGVLQLVYRHAKGNYTFITPRQKTSKLRQELDANLKGAEEKGGSLMYFLVREAASSVSSQVP